MAFFSNTLHKIVTIKLKTDVLLRLGKEKLYSEMLLKKFLELDKNCNYKKLSRDRAANNYEKQLEKRNFLIVYTITVTFLKSNTTISVSDIKGNVKLSFTSGSVKLIGKQKRNRGKSVARLVSLLAKKAVFLKKRPVSIHLHNVTDKKHLTIRKLKKRFFIQLVKTFNTLPYNGCRKRKARRRKRAEKFR
jgi:ribosomal protein S11